MKKFPFVFGCVLALLSIGMALFTFFSAPHGMKWLGDGIDNPSDVAVYLSYLKQGASGHVLLTDLYAVEPNRARFDAFWSTLGIVARTGINPIVIHEGARALGILVLVLALWFAANSVLRNERDARLATILAVGGIGTGWLYSIYLGATHAWTFTTQAAPDIASEFALGPILLGGAHVLFSTALLMTALRFLWTGLSELKRRETILGTIAGVVLLSFHPYFTPLIALMGCLAVASTWKEPAGKGRRVVWLFLVGLTMVPPVAYYVWQLMDPVFGSHHLIENILPLSPLPVWLATLAPFLVALVWMWRKKQLPKKFDWMSAWIIATLILLVVLPVPWKRKLTEGLMVPLVFLTMPAWMAVREWLAAQEPKLMRRLLTGLLLLAAFLGPIHLITSQIIWMSSPATQSYFYQPTELFEITSELAKQQGAILLSDNRWVNVWLPALSGQRVWLGHDQETPDFALKLELYGYLLSATDSTEAEAILQSIGVTQFITTSEANRVRFGALLGADWKEAITLGTIGVWEKR